MPFNGNIGLHDATWRSTFGGTIYKTSGSHGCVNLPPAVAKTIFENIAAGVPVLCYHLPGTESQTASNGTSKPAETKPATEPTTAAKPTERRRRLRLQQQRQRLRLLLRPRNRRQRLQQALLQKTVRSDLGFQIALERRKQGLAYISNAVRKGIYGSKTLWLRCRLFT